MNETSGSFEWTSSLGLSVAATVRRLKADVRIADGETDVVVVDWVIEVRHREGLVLVVFTESLSMDPLAPYLERIAEGRAALLLLGRLPPDVSLPRAAMVSVLSDEPSDESLYYAIVGLVERMELRHRDERKAKTLSRYRYELGELIEIARAVSQERNTTRLLNLILEKSRFVTGADAGSVYVTEQDPKDPKKMVLRFKLSQNDSVAYESSEFTIPVSTRSIAGNAVVTRRAVNIPDAYEIPKDAPYGFDRSFDEKVGYRTRSVIAVPLISAEDEVIGVIQLINRKNAPEKLLRTPEDFQTLVEPFNARSEELLQTVASQAGIALENALLYEEIRHIFEGFVRASVQAIEQRDPTTSGHSMRVSVLSCALAQALDREPSGPYAGVTFTRREIKELEYASLLHDFGKIGVREQVLVKAKKLYPGQLGAVKARFDYVRRTAEMESLRERVALLERGASAAEIEALEIALEARRAAVKDAWDLVLAANEPTVLKEGDFTRIAELARISYRDADGAEVPLLLPDEITSLGVTRGSLSPEEIDEIRSHVVHTYNFLSGIPWGKTFARVPEIAGAHHERLNGTGYPRGILEQEIPLQSKIMTIADIYDALTARDRPYKRAIPTEKALDILGFEVKEKHVDAELVRIFREAGVFKAVEG